MKKQYFKWMEFVSILIKRFQNGIGIKMESELK